MQKETGMLSPEQVKGREDMARLGQEYRRSADKLQSRLAELKSALLFAPPKERKMIKARIALLEREMYDARKIGADAETFYLPGHRFLPRGSKTAMQTGRYVC